MKKFGHLYSYTFPSGNTIQSDSLAELAREVAECRFAETWWDLSYGEQCGEAVKVMYEIADDYPAPGRST